jgi:hypothetical protein
VYVDERPMPASLSTFVSIVGLKVRFVVPVLSMLPSFSFSIVYHEIKGVINGKQGLQAVIP